MFWMILLSGLVFWFYSRYKRMTLLNLNNVPTPPKNFILGCLAQLRSDIQLKSYENWIKDYVKVDGYYIGGNPSVIVSDLELLQKVQSDFFNFTNRHFPVGS